MGKNRRCKNWNEAELEILRQNYETLTHREIGQMLGRSEKGVRNKCYELRLRKKGPEWTEEELCRLRKFYSGREGKSIDLSSIETVFPGKLRSNICRKARELGLTDLRRPASEKTVQAMRKRMQYWWQEHKHPRGYLGHKHIDATKAKMAAATRRMWDDPNHRVNSEEHKQEISDRFLQLRKEGKLRKRYSRGRMGKREDLGGLFVRSSWEANYCRYLNFLIEHGEIASWEYEPDTFWFHAIKRGTRSYTPDFKVFEHDGSFEYHEVKGWMDQKSKTRLKRMKKYYPEVPLLLIDAPVYRAIQRDVSAFIEHWER